VFDILVSGLSNLPREEKLWKQEVFTILSLEKSLERILKALPSSITLVSVPLALVSIVECFVGSRTFQNRLQLTLDQ
jgi:uncharacterized protein YybS (DUF2232 family)